jgi:ribonuclease HI
MTLKDHTSQSSRPYLIFTDGASSGNPGPGGWAYICVSPEQNIEENGGHEPHTTNNAMELTATIQALASLAHISPSPRIEIYTDSTYVILGITRWVHAWKKRSWLTLEGTPIANLELWKKLLALTSKKDIQWKYVKGHAGVPGNERADQLAVSYSQRTPLSLFRGHLKDYRFSILELPSQTEVPIRNQNAKNRNSSQAAASYLSLINGILKKHSTWNECESWVKGKSGARFKKAMNEDEEKEILLTWGFDPLSPPYQKP